MKKILFLQIKNDPNGGVRFVNKVLSEGFANDGNEVRICSIREGDSEGPKTYDGIQIDVINKKDPWEITHKKDVIKGIKKFAFFRTFMKYLHDDSQLKNDYLKLREYIEDFKPDYIIACHYQVLPGIPEEYYKKTINIHHSGYWLLNERFIDNKRKLMELKDKIRFVWLTKRSCEDAVRDGFTNSTYIYNPIKFVCDDKVDVNKNKKLVTIARFGPEKRVELMIDLVNEAFKEVDDWTCELYGYGSEDIIEDKLAEIDNDRIKFMGSCSNPQEVLKTSSVYLCTSVFEGFSLSILEAYECGLPVIAFDFGESCREEILNKKTGFIIEQGNKEDYVNKLVAMMTDKDLLKELSKDSKKFAKQFNVKNVLGNWYKEFELIDKKQ